MPQPAISLRRPRPAEDPAPSADFPYPSKLVSVYGSNIHYIDEGDGQTVLFIHGNPTSSYLWRNIIPFMLPHCRVIALDLIGFGKSDKPDVDYRFQTHADYLEGFIQALGLKDITLVLHDWGSALGLNYASKNQHNVRGIAVMEGMLPPALPFPNYGAMGVVADTFRLMRNPNVNRQLLMENNAFIEEILPGGVVREMCEVTMDSYRKPFLNTDDRLPILVWPNEIPIEGQPETTHVIIKDYVRWLQTTELPILHLYARPGAINPPQVAEWLSQNLRDIETQYVGRGLHYIQEDQPEAIGRAISDWFRRRIDKNSSDIVSD